MQRKYKLRIFEILEKAKPGDTTSLVFDWFLILLIAANVLMVILESFQNFKTSYEQSLKVFETVSVYLFTIEYLTRIWTAVLKFPRKHAYLSVFAFIFSGMAIIDLLAILPFYIPITVVVDFRILRILRLTRVIRILKIGRYSTSLLLIGRVLKRSKSDLTVTVFVMLLLMLLSSALMYYVENPAQPDAFPNIIASAWWTIVTLTTVGYGDVYPITALGKLLGGVIALLGIGLVALPTGIISSGFMEEIRIRGQEQNMRNERNEIQRCPYCNRIIESSIKTKDD
ncbi:MAG: hypothetical protein CVV52_00595 [Spirochaetae bacterium HGW-Spirochaetae-8]|jgi:voltage-gated potassium channel|nr:MAG: hypothetical protein CVV52_00595 [Spirochaetae bacterium HGW-Spirochaetae-8]